MNLMGLPTEPLPADLELRLRRAGLDLPLLGSFAERFVQPGLLFGFAAFNQQEIVAGVARVATALRERQRA